MVPVGYFYDKIIFGIKLNDGSNNSCMPSFDQVKSSPTG